MLKRAVSMALFATGIGFGVHQAAPRPDGGPAPVPVPPPPLSFQVTYTYGTPSSSATLRVGEQSFQVRPGTVLPPPELGEPRLIVTGIEEHGVKAYDCVARTIVRVESSELRVHGHYIKDAPTCYAVERVGAGYRSKIALHGKYYMVSPGDRIPAEKPELRVVAIGPWWVDVEGLGANYSPNDGDLDLEGI